MSVRDVLRALVRKNQRLSALRAEVNWLRGGCPVPPPHLVKVRMLKRLATKYATSLFVETGTFHGTTVAALAEQCVHAYTIELSPHLHRRAVARWGHISNIEFIEGDSAVELARLLPRIEAPCLFWLDGHWSGGDTARGGTTTPVLAELDHILRAPDLGHVVVIDDARLFGSDPDYPTLGEIERRVASADRRMRVQNDAVVITPLPSEPP